MTAGVVLAAGRSTRIGRPKALLPISPGPTFLDRILASLRGGGVDDVTVVLGGHAAEIAAAFPVLPAGVRFAHNPAFAHGGQLSSLLVGVDAAEQHGAERLLVTLIDMPLVTADSVRAVVAAAMRTPRPPIVRATYRGAHGHPVVFDKSLFAELRAADARVGAKQVVRTHAAEVVDLDLPDPGVIADIDTRDDYERVVGPLDRV